MRALETAAGVFGGGPFDGCGRPLMLAQTEAEDERAAHGAVACAEGLPFIAFEGCRERLGAPRPDPRLSRLDPAPPPAGCPGPACRRRVHLRVAADAAVGQRTVLAAFGALMRACARAAGTSTPCRACGLSRAPRAARAGAASCDRRRDIRHAVAAFPGVDFSHIEPGADAIYHKHRVETEPAVMERGLRFLQWLMARCETLPLPSCRRPGGAPRGGAPRPPPRPAGCCEACWRALSGGVAPRSPESRIAVVTHCGFLFLTLSAFGHDCAQPVQARPTLARPFPARPAPASAGCCSPSAAPPALTHAAQKAAAPARRTSCTARLTTASCGAWWSRTRRAAARWTPRGGPAAAPGCDGARLERRARGANAAPGGRHHILSGARACRSLGCG